VLMPFGVPALRALFVSCTLFAAVGCGDDPDQTSSPGAGGSSSDGGGGSGDSLAGGIGVGGSGVSSEPLIIGGDRPIEVFVPSAYDGTEALPFVMLLHGYSGTGEQYESFFQLEALAESRGFFYAYPNGLAEASGDQYWNATDACCDFYQKGTDDSAYLSGLIDELAERVEIDGRRVYIIGHSNGGFMAHRMACDHADKVAAITAISGTRPFKAEDCTPSELVSVLQVHGIADENIGYAGGKIIGHEYPGASETADAWAAANACSEASSIQADALDLDLSVPGPETTIRAYDDCPTGGSVELWMMNDVGHTPDISPDFVPSLLDFLFAHPKL